MAKKPENKTEIKKPRAKRVKAAKAAAPEAETPVATTAAGPSSEEIRDRAYQIFRTGVNQSDPVADWFQAERELKAGSRV
jgi:Protein of unknown function (DUF2934)